MDKRQWVQLWYWLSFFFEAVGVGLVVVDLGKMRKEASTFLSRGKTVYLRAAAAAGSSGEAKLEGGQPPTLDERVKQLEADARSLRVELAALRTNPPWREEMVGLATDVERWARDQVQAIEKVLSGLTIGGLKVRIVGAGFIAFGVLANLVGNLLSLGL